jgi:hypothetical protein
MSGKLLLSTAYLPPVEYFALIKKADTILIEKEENYLKQTYRNRCRILSPNGPQLLSVPVKKGSLHKTKLKEIEIDYSKRWQQVHLRAFSSSYGSSPYFLYYYSDFERIIVRNHRFLLDLNMELLESILDILKLSVSVYFTSVFEPVASSDCDFRYRITPKTGSDYKANEYYQVFRGRSFVPDLSIIDLIFNMGPESTGLL